MGVSGQLHAQAVCMLAASKSHKITALADTECVKDLNIEPCCT
jgi:hypothetical protein